LIKCNNLQMPSNMPSTELKNRKMGVGTSDICENYCLRLAFCTIPVSVNIFTVRDHITAVGFVECNLDEF
jgi:hypothetical protein